MHLCYVYNMITETYSIRFEKDESTKSLRNYGIALAEKIIFFFY